MEWGWDDGTGVMVRGARVHVGEGGLLLGRRGCRQGRLGRAGRQRLLGCGEGGADWMPGQGHPGLMARRGLHLQHTGTGGSPWADDERWDLHLQHTGRDGRVTLG